MKTRELTKIAFLASLLMMGYLLCANILYVEVVTFLTLIYGCTQQRKLAVMACFCFGLLVLLLYGIFPWSLMYCVIFPCYAWLASCLKKWLLKGDVACILLSFIFAFLLGQLIDLPFWLFSGKLTIMYMIAGLKASLIQGVICAIESACFFRSVSQRILKMEE